MMKRKMISGALALAILLCTNVSTALAAPSTGWSKQGSAWTYTVNGKKSTGWKKVGSKWYLFNGSGKMLTGWQKSGGKWYYMASSGAMKTGWVKVSGKWYYMNGSGAMVTGWKQLGSKWYYMSGSGVMVTGTQKIGGKSYTFNSSGVWQQGGSKSSSSPSKDSEAPYGRCKWYNSPLMYDSSIKKAKGTLEEISRDWSYKVFLEINKIRAEEGYPPAEWDENLYQGAQAWARVNAKENRNFHGSSKDLLDKYGKYYTRENSGMESCVNGTGSIRNTAEALTRHNPQLIHNCSKIGVGAMIRYQGSWTTDFVVARGKIR